MDREFVAMIERAHHGQEYKGGIPYKHHLHRVAHLVVHAVEMNGERCDLQELAKAALAHDSLEDTSLTERELLKYCKPLTVEWVKALTKPVDEEHPPRKKYHAQLLAAGEEACLIKLADLFDNMMTGSRRIKENSLDWTRDVFLPIMDDAHRAMQAVDFRCFDKAGRQLQEMCKYAFEMLQDEIRRWET
ncbi:hypothetical protein HY489_05400 [Candidatus Woesearchaeota archaeon]|nr:hypothetical protein [Candidatus Woesearchaeota archaeon]